MAPVSESDCKRDRREVYERLNSMITRRMFISFFSLMSLMVLGCYGFVWSANGEVVDILDGIKSDINNVKIEVAVTKTIVETNGMYTTVELERMRSTLSTQEDHLDKVRESLARIEDNNHE